MKNTGTCPKCGSNEICRIPGWVGAYGSGSNIPVGFMGAAKVARYLCCGCGYAEEWVEERRDIDRLVKKYGKE
jgi:hypothetical protein